MIVLYKAGIFQGVEKRENVTNRSFIFVMRN
jgi:hypothetical protein